VTDSSTDKHPVISAAIIVSDGRLLLVQRRVSEGALSWQFPAGAVETLEEAATRETIEKVGLVVTPDRLLGERTHLKTGRRMAYVACTVVSGSAHVADTDELSDIAWATPAKFDDYVPTASPPMVQDYLAAALA